MFQTRRPGQDENEKGQTLAWIGKSGVSDS